MLISNSTFLLLTILEDIRFVVKPTSKDNITKGSSFSLFCAVKSSRQVQYKWRFNGEDLKYDDNHIWYEENRLLIQNANVSIKDVKGLMTEDGGIYIIGPIDCENIDFKIILFPVFIKILAAFLKRLSKTYM